MIDYTALCCTAALREHMKPLRGNLILLSDNARVHDQWYAQLCSVERRHCVLFTHAETFYSVMAISQSSDNIRDLRKLFISSITQQLNAERIANGKQQHILSTWQAIGYRAASDKRLLGIITDLIRDYRIAIDSNDGVLRCDIDYINRVLNRHNTAFSNDEPCPAQRFANRFQVNLAAITRSNNGEVKIEYAEITPE